MVARVKTVSFSMVMLFLLAFSSSQKVYAKDDLFWAERILPAYSKAAKEKNCQAMWNMLWPEAKKANLQARRMLSLSVAPLMHMDQIVMPGHSDDFITHLRDGLILMVHSSGVKYEKEYAGDQILENLFYSKVLSKEAHNRFWDCVLNVKSERCTAIAVEDNIVPPFNDYVAEIDEALKNGHKASCNFLPGEAVDISGTGEK